MRGFNGLGYPPFLAVWGRRAPPWQCRALSEGFTTAPLTGFMRCEVTAVDLYDKGPMYGGPKLQNQPAVPSQPSPALWATTKVTWRHLIGLYVQPSLCLYVSTFYAYEHYGRVFFCSVSEICPCLCQGFPLGTTCSDALQPNVYLLQPMVAWKGF